MPKTMSTYQANRGKLPTKVMKKTNFSLPNMSKIITKTKEKAKRGFAKGVVKFIGDTPAGKELKKGLDKQGIKY